jgi:hypothetical protein
MRRKFARMSLDCVPARGRTVFGRCGFKNHRAERLLRSGPSVLVAECEASRGPQSLSDSTCTMSTKWRHEFDIRAWPKTLKRKGLSCSEGGKRRTAGYCCTIAVAKCRFGTGLVCWSVLGRAFDSTKTRLLILFQVALPSVAESEGDSDRHETEGREQKDKYAPADSALTCFGSRFG